MPVSFSKISVGSFWSRPSLAEIWGYKAYQALARGVVTPANDNKIILFVTEEKQASATSYQDVLKGDLLEWEGPNDHFAEARMVNAENSGEEIHLFHRSRHHENFEYLGEIKVKNYIGRSNYPSKFTFEISDPDRQSWAHEELLAAFFMYMQLKPTDLLDSSPSMERFAAAIKKPKRAVARKLRTLAQLDPVMRVHSDSASGNVTALDRAVWSQFKENWTQTTLKAGESFEAIAGSYWDVTESNQVASGDVRYLFQEGQTREAIVRVRRNQYVFRQAVLNSYASTCCISGVKNEKLLIASHIIPWAEDQKNRLNPENGLCLSALHDRAYDQGLITVLPDYTIRVSSVLHESSSDDFLRTALLAFEGRQIEPPTRFRPDPLFLKAHATRFGFIKV